jgi:MFS transporter, ACS family, glucarate transporter
MNMGAQIGGAVTASLTPAIASHFGWTASFLVAAALCLTGAVSWTLVDPNRALEVAATEAQAEMETGVIDRGRFERLTS